MFAQRPAFASHVLQSAIVIVLASMDGEESFRAVDIFLNVLAVGFVLEMDNVPPQGLQPWPLSMRLRC